MQYITMSPANGMCRPHSANPCSVKAWLSRHSGSREGHLTAYTGYFIGAARRRLGCLQWSRLPRGPVPSSFYALRSPAPAGLTPGLRLIFPPPLPEWGPIHAPAAWACRKCPWLSPHQKRQNAVLTLAGNTNSILREGAIAQFPRGRGPTGQVVRRRAIAVLGHLPLLHPHMRFLHPWSGPPTRHTLPSNSAAARVRLRVNKL